jgi:hypothetical protein
MHTRCNQTFYLYSVKLTENVHTLPSDDYLYEVALTENVHMLPSDVLSLLSNTYRKRTHVTIRRSIFTK